MDAGLGGRKRENIRLEQDIRKKMVTNHKGTSISISLRTASLSAILIQAEGDRSMRQREMFLRDISEGLYEIHSSRYSCIPSNQSELTFYSYCTDII